MSWKQGALTLSEQIKQIGPDGIIMDIVNTLEEKNQMDLDAVYQEANERFSHLSSKVLSLPDIGKRRINRGVPGGVGRTKRHREFIQILEAHPNVDTLLLKSEKDKGYAARKNQIRMFVEAMAQEKAGALIYGNNEEDEEEIDGFFTRYDDLALANVHGIGGTGSDVASLLLVEWDAARCCLIYPSAVPNSGATEMLGISREDMGRQRIEDDNGSRYVMEDVIQVAFGINIVDDRCVQRLANIESDGSDNTLFATAKMHSLVRAINKLPSYGANAVIYVNRDIKSQFDIYALDKLLGCYQVTQTDGAPITMFRNIPVRMMESMLSTETAIT